MDQAADKIEAHIDRTRERLGSNLRELEEKVEAATDWRAHYQARPQYFLGGAFAAGVLLAATVRPRSVRRSSEPSDGSQFEFESSGNVPGQLLEVWDNVRSALIAVAATQIAKYIGDRIPGFDEHYRRIAGDSGSQRA